MKIFKPAEVAAIFEFENVNRHFFIHLAETKVIRPMRDSRGRGKSREYSYLNLLEIGIFIYLTKFKVSYEKASMTLSIIKKSFDLLADVLHVVVIGFVGGRAEDIYIRGSGSGGKVEYARIPGGKDGPGFDMMGMPIMPTLIRTIDFYLEKEPKAAAQGFAYCFVLNVRNIRHYVDERIIEIMARG